MDKKIIIYGAGKRGESIYHFLESLNMTKYISCFCDKNANDISDINGVTVIQPDEAIKKGLPYWVALADEKIRKQVTEELLVSGCTVYENLSTALLACGCIINATEFNRLYCAFCHDCKMESYFERAELHESLEIFWNENGVFYNMFKTLDLSSVIELACGHGRHVAKYIDNAGHVTLVDILQNNISHCKKRYKNYSNITYYKNNGYNLQELNDNTYTSLFAYDAMVHFEMFDIYEYLKDIYRVLKPGAMALLHHSNNYDAEASFASSQHARNFMSKELFKYLALQAGFVVVKQQVIDWGVKDLDCISLLRKP